MVTRKTLEKKIAKYKEETVQLAQEKEVDGTKLRMFHKLLKRAQRKLTSLVRNEERLAASSGKGKKKARAVEEVKAPAEEKTPAVEQEAAAEEKAPDEEQTPAKEEAPAAEQKAAAEE